MALNGPGLESHPNSMLIAFWDEKCKKTRHIFVYAEVGKVHIHKCEPWSIVTESKIESCSDNEGNFRCKGIPYI